tara:strand:+ start:1617 stop:2924 length:1308 start_codon:yes stop_codon:yes gene_type:complete
MKNTLIDLINKNKCIVGIIGLGYVGLPLALRFSEKNYKTYGFDIDESKIKQLNDCETYIKHISSDQIKASIEEGFVPTSDFSKISEMDAILICVPTPLGDHNEPDLSFIHSTLEAIKPYLSEGQILTLESTTYPGTTDEHIVPVIQDLGFNIGENYFIGYSPEREDPGNKDFSTKNIPKIVSGHSSHCLEINLLLYSQIVNKAIPVSSTKVAEMTKILENIHRAVNIGLVNELKVISDKMDIDIYEVIKAAATKPFGFTAYYPGPGLGGHCIPIDPFYLSWKAKEFGMSTRFIELAGEINTAMPSYVVKKSAETLNKKSKSINGSKILVLGLSYKKNVDDLRESPSLEIISDLVNMGSKVKFADPYFKKIPPTRKYNLQNVDGITLDSHSLQKFDLVILATDHDIFNYDLIKEHSKIIIDTRGRFESIPNKIIKA